ncbi:MAG TPA: AAA family ATPase [Solirubrobacteraceae bacterium]|nr:AAA family ATPase [Solirubrobacteraceae bacterium]
MRLDPVEVRETHISRVLLTRDRAFKFKKPVRLPFVDYSTLERRHSFCREEVRLNRRLAPDIYRGVRAVVATETGVELAPEDADGAVDYVVEMRRYDERCTLAHRLAAGSAGEAEVCAVGRRLAEFHASADLPPQPEGAVPALAAMLAENFATLQALGADVDDAERLADAFVSGRRAELERRARAGLVRDGHGDLRAEHVVLERGIEIVDCVEFDPTLRQIDVGLDLAFLVMDLLRHDERPAAALVRAYREAGGDPGDDALLSFFAAQRALIRAKVALVRATQVDPVDAARRRADAASLLELANRLGWGLRLGPAVIVCGPAASGKSTLAAALVERAGATVLSSDAVRKELAGIAPTARASADTYEPAMNRRTYTGLGARARELVGAGQRVVVDATFRFTADREAFASAFTNAADVMWIECRAPAEVLVARASARERRPGVSDAGPSIAFRQTREWQPLATPEHLVVRTDRDGAAVLAAVRDGLDARLRGELRSGTVV